MNRDVGVHRRGRPYRALLRVLHRLIQMHVSRDALTSQSCPANKRLLQSRTLRAQLRDRARQEWT